MMAMLLLSLTPIVMAIALSANVEVAQAHDSDPFCYRKCAQAVKHDLRSCRSESRRCVQRNVGDPLNVADYCLDAFLGACERTAKGDYETCLAEQCGVDLLTLRSDATFEAATADEPAASCTTNDDVVVNDILTSIVQVVDNNWETIACKEGLCPLNNVYSGKINIGCNANSGLHDALETYCAATLGHCKSFYAEVTVQSIDGLQYLDFSDPVAQNVSAGTGTQPCPYSSSANNGLDLDCAYSGTANGDVAITSGNQITTDVSEFKVKVKCGNSLYNETYTLYNDGFTCKASTATGNVTFGYCVGTCANAPEGVVSYLKVPSKSDVALKPGDTTCDIDGSEFTAAIREDFEKAFEPLFKQQLANALKDPLKDVVNSIIPSLPYPPAACAGSVASPARWSPRWRQSAWSGG